MRDRELMGVCEVIDDEVGIWDISTWFIDPDAIEKFLKAYGEDGLDAINKDLKFLEKEVKRIWKDLDKEKK